MINIEDFGKVEIRAGKIISAEPIEGSDKLLRLTVDFGEERLRQVLSGIKAHFPDTEKLVDKTCAFVTNLEPRKMMGLDSEAMIMAASGNEENPFFTLLEMDCPPGSKVK